MGEFLRSVMIYLAQVLAATGSQLFILLGPGALLALLMYFISQLLRDQAAEVFGYRFWVYLSAPGTVLHELGHALFAVIFGHRIVDLKLFDPDGGDGMLGSVTHSYQENNLYHLIGNFFIGIGPIILGSLVIFLSANWLVGPQVFLPLSQMPIDPQAFASLEQALNFGRRIIEQSMLVFAALFEPQNFTNWKFYLFIYLTFAIGTHVKLSPPDLSGALSGFGVLAALVLVINLLTLWIGSYASRVILLLSQSYSFFYGIMLFTILLCLIFLIVVSVLAALRRLIRRRLGGYYSG